MSADRIDAATLERVIEYLEHAPKLCGEMIVAPPNFASCCYKLAGHEGEHHGVTMAGDEVCWR